jgi:hypothetical protein
MSKKFSKLPQGPVLGSFLVLGNEDWAEIESETAYKLPQNVRDLLGLATLYLTLMLPQEKSAPRLDAKITEKLTMLQMQAQNLRAELFSPHYWKENYQPSGSPIDLENKLALELQDIRENPNNPFGLLRFSLGATIASCERVLKTVGDLKDGNFRDGLTYDTWIVLTTLVMKSNGLQYGAGNSRRREETKSSPFVKLIKELQQRALQKPVQSDHALAKAINRARASINVSDIEDSEVEALIYNILRATKPSERSRLSSVSDYRDADGYGALQELVNIVLEGRRVGLHSVVPEPFYYTNDMPPPGGSR